MNTPCAVCSLTIFLSVASANAIVIREGSSRFDSPTSPLELHRQLRRPKGETITRSNRPAPPLFASPASTDAQPNDRPPLVLNSLRFDVDVEYGDVLRRSWAQSSDFIARTFLRRNLRHLVRESVVDFDRNRVRVFAPGVDARLAKGVAYFPERHTVTYAGPVGIQVLSRSELTTLVKADSAPEVVHQAVPYVGLELKWWFVGPQMSVSRAKALATIDSRRMTVRPGSVASDLDVSIDPIDWARAVADVREILADERARAEKLESKLDVPGMDFRVTAYLLDEDLKPIAEYPLAPGVTKRLVNEAAEAKSRFAGCGRWLTGLWSSDQGF